MKIKIKLISYFKFLLSLIFNFRNTIFALRNKYSESSRNNQDHIRDAANWLLNAQINSKDDGYSRFYSLYNSNWDRGYIETTGYIIPSMINASRYTSDKSYRESAIVAAEWLLNIQNSDGSFNDVDHDIPQVFDTGQCLIGLNFLYKETNDDRYLKAATKAGLWLCQIQEDSGEWIKSSYNEQPHTYYSRVSSALLELSEITNNNAFFKHGIKNIEWCISQQQDNGFFKFSSFDIDETPVLHTMIYVIEGLIKAYKFTGDMKILDAIYLNTQKLKDINLKRDIILFSRYNHDFEPIDKSRCITGLAQWAGVCIDLYEISNDYDYMRLAMRTIYYLKSKQCISNDPNIHGGFFGSIPFYSNYGSYKLLNWNNKFFIDTLIKYDKYNLEVDDEHDEWTSASFQFCDDQTVNQIITEHDEKYLKIIRSIIDDELKSKKTINILDLGCGKGKFIQHLKQTYNQINFYGVDPVYFDNLNCVKGSAISIPFKDSKFDIVLVIEVLQHARDISMSLSEINRVLVKSGKIFIGDRNKFSVLGAMKKLLERSNNWMYISDSPFTEKWYSKSVWKKHLNFNNFEFQLIKNVNSIKSKIPLMNRYYGIVARKNNE